MTRRRKRALVSMAIAAVAVAGGAAFLFTNCGIQLGAPPEPVPAAVATGEPLEGNWAGTWSSTVRDDGGALVCVVRKLEDGKYDATFKATFAKFFTYKMPVVLEARPVAGGWEFEGRADLGWLHGGVYTYKGRVEGDEFQSTYDSAFDKGIFRMKRVRASE